MFTGLVEKMGTIQSIQELNGFRRIIVNLADAEQFAERLGDSIACNGCCLTVVHSDALTLAFDVSLETLDKTNFAELQPGVTINLERALRSTDRLGGHMVAGHVDAVGRIHQLDRLAGGWNVWLELPKTLAHLVILKGSIAVDGISLTINELKDQEHGSLIRLTLIPATIAHTTAQTWQVGGTVNLEVDLIGKYLERLARPYLV